MVVFVDRFKLRCWPNLRGKFLIAIQLMALPVNRPNKAKATDLPVRCTFAETTTGKQFQAQKTNFDYSRNGSSRVYALMDAPAILDVAEGKEMNLKVVVAVTDH